MKKNLFLFAIICCTTVSSAQNYSWTPQADFGPGIREQGIGFSIGSKGYAGTGRNPSIQNDFWEYNPVNNVWTQKANVPGVVRHGAIGFNIGTKGYVGLGWTTAGQLNDFYEYDPLLNSWTTKANFPGGARYSSVGITIGNKGYVGTGFSPLRNDWWEYDPVTNTWTQKANQPTVLRQAATAFSLNGFGYLGTGYNNGTHYSDFWKYDPANNTWTQIAGYPGGARRGVSSFTIGSQAYVGMGYNDINYFTDFWKYDPATNSWSQITNCGGTPRYACFSFSINENGYIGTGSYGGVNNPQSTSGLWKLDITCTVDAAITAAGPTTFCSPGTVTLNANTGSGLSYQWRINGLNISGATSPSYVAAVSGSYDCVISNICGSATSSVINVTVNTIPSTPGNISGPSGGVCNATVSYSITPVMYATSYNWFVPAGATIASGQGTNFVNVTFASGFVSGTISVSASNSCGTSSVSSITVTSIPSQPGAISGPISVCHNQNNVIYSIAPVPGAASYTWTKPPGATFNSGQGTTSVNIRFGKKPGNVTVRANNSCGSGPVRSLAVAMPCRVDEEIAEEDFEVMLYPNPATNKVHVVFYSLYGNETLRIFNAVGETVLKSEMHSEETQIDINMLSSGIYFAEIISGEQKRILKLIKQ